LNENTKKIKSFQTFERPLVQDSLLSTNLCLFALSPFWFLLIWLIVTMRPLLSSASIIKSSFQRNTNKNVAVMFCWRTST